MSTLARLTASLMTSLPVKKEGVRGASVHHLAWIGDGLAFFILCSVDRCDAHDFVPFLSTVPFRNLTAHRDDVMS